MKFPFRRKVLSVLLSLIGMATIGYLLGAAVMFFNLPSADFLTRAFLGARAWAQRRHAGARTPTAKLPPLRVAPIDSPEKPFHGFTLYATPTLGPETCLADMQV